MSILKMSVLTASAFTLWLAPPFVLSRKIPLHNFTTGLALLGAGACCFEARRVAVKLSQVEEFEAMKSAAISADVADELATEIYVSEQQRRIEAEAILNGGGECSEDVQMLERALALKYNLKYNEDEQNCSEHPKQLAEPDKNRTSNEDVQRAERILELRAKGYGKLKIILEVWGLTRGGGAKYKAAEAEYHRVIDE